MKTDVSDAIKNLTRTQTRQALMKHRQPATKPAKRSPLPPIKKASKLIDERLPLPPELVKGLLYRGSTMVYGGGSKTNKTFAMMDLAVSVATGRPWWDLRTTKGRVLYLDFELQEAFFRERLDKIATAKGVTVEALDNVDVWNLRGHAADLSTIVEEIIQRIKGTPYSLIIIDPIYKVLGERDENSAGDINSLMNELEKMAVTSGASIVVGHHFSKGNQAGKESMDRISGSGVFGRSPDAIVIITKHEQEDVYTVEATLRNHKAMEPFCVQWVYPLMVRNDEHDPAQLKKPGVFKEKFKAEALLQFIEGESLTTTEWQKKACDELKMSPRTFATKKGKLVADKLVKEVNGKWEPMPFSSHWFKKRTQETQLQTANTATAPVAA